MRENDRMSGAAKDRDGDRSRPASASNTSRASDSLIAAAERESLLAMCEFSWLAEIHGAVTPQLWHEQFRADTSRLNSNRQFERIKDRLVERKIPHERVKIDDANGAATIGIKILVHRSKLERYFPGVARPESKMCRGCREDLPIGFDDESARGAGLPLLPGARFGGAFASDTTRADGLDTHCRVCRRLLNGTWYRVKGGAEKKRAYNRSAKVKKYERKRARSGDRKVSAALAKYVFRLVCEGVIERPARCEDPTCGAEGKTFAHFEPYKNAAGKWILRLDFLCCSCGFSRRNSMARKGGNGA